MSIETEDLLRQALQARRETRLVDASRCLRQAVELLRKEGTKSELSQMLRLLGEVDRGIPDLAAAQRHYEEAIDILREIDHAARSSLKEPLKLAHALRHLGDVRREADLTALAEPCLLEALAIYRTSEGTRPLDLANAIRSLAAHKDQSGDLDEGRRLWSEALELYRAAGVTAGVAECVARLGHIPE